MPRQRRVVVPNVPHHVYLRGNNRRRLFSSHGDRVDFLGCLERGLRDSECVLHQLTLMGNHVHLIAAPPDPRALSSLVARTCQRYAQLRNAAREATGKLFEERFHSKVVVDEAALMTMTLYNDANAYRARQIDSPLDDPWSTGPLHAGGRSHIPLRLWTPSRWYTALADTVEGRQARYRELMLAYVARDGVDALSRHTPHEVPAELYRKRVERPDRSSARERSTRWVEKAE